MVVLKTCWTKRNSHLYTFWSNLNNINKSITAIDIGVSNCQKFGHPVVSYKNAERTAFDSTAKFKSQSLPLNVTCVQNNDVLTDMRNDQRELSKFTMLPAKHPIAYFSLETILNRNKDHHHHLAPNSTSLELVLNNYQPSRSVKVFKAFAKKWWF